ncbi:MAG: hypothetical protein NTU85_00745 [Candidatus Kaiserbacteria bacterium]|nr:hypothetical protein [Candidatus Kaiserbacteria bacterium]
MNTNNHNKAHIAERVFDYIKNEHLVPRPRWEFVIKNYFFWLLGALAVAFGALACSATFFEIANVDWRLSAATHTTFFSFFLAAAPFVWIGTLALFICIGYINIRRTNHGYRYSLPIIALGAVLTSLTLGTGLYAIGFGGRIDEAIGDHPPFYRPVLVQQQSWWLAPEKGLLGGEVINVASDLASFTLRDFSGHMWEIDGSDLRNPDLTTIARGGIVRVVGLPVQTGTSASATSSSFHACFVFPWNFRGGPKNGLPPPLAVVASTSKRDATTTQSDLCKNIRPYQQLRDIEDSGF